jgi:eukaryotic-like serine/threonine-protein kinase
MQGDQVVKPKAAGSFQLDQQGRQVNVTSNAVLDAKKTVTLDISGRFVKSNSAPLVFQLGDQKCETYVSSAPGQPSREVQQLSNGQIRLGPPIRSPRPGLNITPGGVIVPIPGPVDSSDPSGTGSTVPGPGPTETTVTEDPCELDPTFPDCTQAPSPTLPESETPSTGGGGPTEEETVTPPTDPTTLPPDDDDNGDDTTGGTGGTGGGPETTSGEGGTPSVIPPPPGV